MELDCSQVDALLAFKDAASKYIGSLASKSHHHESRSKLNMEDKFDDSGKNGNSLNNLLQLHKIKVENVPRGQSTLHDMGLSILDIHVDDDEGDADVGAGISSSTDYELPPAAIDYKAACQILEVYKRGGRVCYDSVHRILRAGYRSLQNLNNVSRVSIDDEETRLIVVGDLHGKCGGGGICNVLLVDP